MENYEEVIRQIQTWPIADLLIKSFELNNVKPDAMVLPKNMHSKYIDRMHSPQRFLGLHSRFAAKKAVKAWALEMDLTSSFTDTSGESHDITLAGYLGQDGVIYGTQGSIQKVKGKDLLISRHEVERREDLSDMNEYDTLREALGRTALSHGLSDSIARSQFWFDF